MNPIKLILLFLFFPLIVFSQHTIKATFSPAKDYKWAILYKTTPTSNEYISQGKINDGKITFKLDKKAEPGIYKITYNVPQEEFNFDVIYDGKEDIELTFNEDKGLVFQKSTDNILLNNYLQDMSIVNTQIGEFYAQKKQDTTELLNLFKQQREIQVTFEKKAVNSLALPFIKANQPYIPSHYEDDETYIHNLIGNYFSNIDFNDPVLQSSRFLMDRTIGYIFGAYTENENKISAFNKNIDVIEKHLLKTEETYHKIFLEDLWNRLVFYKLSQNANYLADTYLIPIAKKLNDTQLVEELLRFKNLSIGNVAPDFTLEIEENGTKKTQQLRELSIAENYILVFWSSTCSHCLHVLPKFQKFINNQESNKYQVIAIGLESEKDEMGWKNQTKYYPEFIHVLGLNKWENKIAKSYDIVATPTFILLDKDKKILLKPDNLKELENYINSKQ